jgi:WD40 repeat protein
MPLRSGLHLLIALAALLNMTRAEPVNAADQQNTAAARPARTDRYGDALPPGALLRLGTWRLSHEADAWTVLFTPDGKWIVSGDERGRERNPGAIRVWDAQTGALVRAFGVDDHGGYGVLALAPDGFTLAAQWGNVLTRFFDVRSGKQLPGITQPEGEPEHVRLVTFTPDGRALAAIDDNFQIRFWDFATRKFIRQLGDDARAAHLAVSPDGKRLAILYEQNLLVRDAETGKELWRCKEDVGGFYAVAFAPDGKTLAGGGRHGTVGLWAVPSATPVRLLRGHKGMVHALSFSPDGKILASAADDGTVRLWEVNSGKELHVLRGHMGAVYSVAFCPDGKTLASAGLDGLVRLWEVSTGKDRLPFAGHREPIKRFALLPSGKQLLSVGIDATVRRWDLSSGKDVQQSTRGMDYNGCESAISPDGSLLAWPTLVGTLRVWDIDAGKERLLIRPGQADITAFSFTHDSKGLASAAVDGTVCLRDLKTGVVAWRLGGKNDSSAFGARRRMTFSPNGRMLASSDRQGVIQLWDIPKGREAHRLRRSKDDLIRLGGGVTQDEDINCLTFSPDSRWLAAGYWWDKPNIAVWDTRSGRLRCHLAGHDRHTMDLAFSLDSRFLASLGNGEDPIRLWELATGKEVHGFDPGEDGAFGQIVFTPDGRRLISKGRLTILVWDATGLADAAVPKRLDVRELKELWADLLGNDAALACRAVWRMSAVPEQSVPFLRERLRPAPGATRQDIARWIADLDDNDFAVR